MPVVPPPVFVVAAGLAQHVVAPKRRPGPVRLFAGGVVGLASVGLLAAANDRFHRRHTTVNPIRPDRATTLVSDGVFAHTRNPMYVGMAGVLAANAIARGGWLTLLPVAAFVAVIDRLQIPAEEQALSAKFGDDYADYRRRTPRWLGPTGGGWEGVPVD